MKINKTTIIDKKTIDELNANVQELIYWIMQLNTCEESPINDYMKNTDEIIDGIQNDMETPKSMYLIMHTDSDDFKAITNDYHKWIDEHNQDPALDDDEKYTLDDFRIIDLKPTIY